MERNIDNYSGTKSDALPSWEERELSGDYTQSLQKRAGFDIPFLLLVLIILLIGVVMVLSASFPRGFYSKGEPLRIFSRQLIFAVSGIALMLVVSRINVKTMRNWSFLLMIASVILLAAVLVIGKKVNGARRWIDLGITDFQPSEIAKLAIVMSFSSMICAFNKKMKTFKYGVLPFGIIVAVVVGLLVLEPHLSASVIIVALAAIMMFAGGTELKWFALAGGIMVAAIGIVLLTNLKAPDVQSTNSQTVGTAQAAEEGAKENKLGYAGSRIGAWLDPESDPQGKGFQIRQSLYAVGSGGLFGQGLGQSRQKYLYLPEEHNDYIFAIVCEELGFIGAMLILLLFALLIVRGYWLALHANDRYGSLVITGITSLLAIQVFLNVAVVTNLVPSTGISLPFFSYGGTALWIQLVEMGIILAVSRDIPLTRAG